jgi:hexosaminidase
MARTVGRVLPQLRAAALQGGWQADEPVLTAVEIQLTSPREEDERVVTSRTCYNYTLNYSRAAPVARVSAASAFGAAYALEGLLQLLGHPQAPGRLVVGELILHDSPRYAWRGLMIDAGRRFFPVPLVRNLLDTMAAVKLNVLHLHASDHCRFAIESKLFPNLTASLVGARAGHYTQADIASLVGYAADRGIRVVPEIDVPGHARGMLPIERTEGQGVQFCDPSDVHRSQLYNDPENKTYGAIHALLGEMAGLFPDESFHIGCDETRVKGRCSLQSTFSFERRLAQAIATDFHKKPEGWEEIFFDAGAATSQTIVNTWSHHTAAEVTATGRQAVESHAPSFYFTRPAPGGPKGWAKCWYDIGVGVPKNETVLLLGGEMSMWSDTYCDTEQCGAFPNVKKPVGASLFPPEKDGAFGQSIGGMIWPRGFVGAAAFWQYNSTADPASASFTSAIWQLNNDLRKRGALTCPNNCDCDQLTACGKPYD